MIVVQGGNEYDVVTVNQSGSKNIATINQDVSGGNSINDIVNVRQSGYDNTATITQQ